VAAKALPDMRAMMAMTWSEKISASAVAGRAE
jgi:hypothetical protein